MKNPKFNIGEFVLTKNLELGKINKITNSGYYINIGNFTYHFCQDDLFTINTQMVEKLESALNQIKSNNLISD